MHSLPEPKPTAPAAGQATPTAADYENIRRLFAALDEIKAEQPTAVRVDDQSIPSYKDGPRIGDTPHVPQPDSRIVPAWALGLAVGSIGVGVGSIGLGCAVWLACKGLSSVIHSLSSVTLAGVLTVAIPFAGIAMVVTAIGGAFNKVRSVNTTTNNHYNGPVRQESRVNKQTGIWNKNISE
jgi:hypothetical protein